MGELSSAAAGGAGHRVDGAADYEVDSDADTVQQETSPLEQMRVDTEAEVSLPFSSVEMVPDSPLGDTYNDKCAEVNTDSALAESTAASGHGMQLQHSAAMSAVHNVYNGNTDLSLGPSVRGGEVGKDVLPAEGSHVNTAVRVGVGGESVSGGAQDLCTTMQRRRPYGTRVWSGMMETLVRWSGVGRMNGIGPRGGDNDRHVEQADAGLETRDDAGQKSHFCTEPSTGDADSMHVRMHG